MKFYIGIYRIYKEKLFIPSSSKLFYLGLVQQRFQNCYRSGKSEKNVDKLNLNFI